MLAVSLDTVLVRDTEPATTTLVDGNVVAVSIRAGFYFGFNRVGSEIWTMLAEPHSVERIVEALAPHYDIDREILAQDVVSFLQSLVDARLVRRLDGEGNPR